jgi:rusticyanin
MAIPTGAEVGASRPSRGIIVGVVLLIVGLVVGVGIGYVIAPRPVTTPAVNTISISESMVHLSVLSGPDTDFSFLIGGLENPTIEIDRGANVTIHFLNIGAVPHSWVLLTAAPPYAAEPPAEVAFPGAETPDAMMGTPSDGSATTAFTSSSAGTYWYVCHVPGHAASAMFGKFVVR